MTDADTTPVPSEPTIRPYREGDLQQVYDVCVRTADAGGDARGMYDTDQVMGDIFAAPYVVLEPETAFVLEDAGQVVGYIVGTADTAAFVAAYRERWMPQVADRYPPTDRVAVTPTELLLVLHHNPERMLETDLVNYPAHLHIDLLPDYQRRGLGKLLMARLLEALRAAGAPAVHLGVLSSNTSARAFYARMGFVELDLVDPSGMGTFLGRSTSGGV